MSIERISVEQLPGALPLAEAEPARPYTLEELAATYDPRGMAPDDTLPQTIDGLVAYERASIDEELRLAAAWMPDSPGAEMPRVLSTGIARLETTGLTDLLSRHLGFPASQFAASGVGLRVLSNLYKGKTSGKPSLSLTYQRARRRRYPPVHMFALRVDGGHVNMHCATAYESVPVAGTADIAAVPGVIGALAVDLAALRRARLARWSAED